MSLSDSILEVIYANLFRDYRLYIFDDDNEGQGNPDVTKHLIAAYLAACEDENPDVEVACLSGTAAEQYMRNVYLQACMRVYPGTAAHQHEEGWMWPDELPYDAMIPKKIMKAFANRIARYYERVQKQCREYREEQQNVKYDG